MHEYLIPLYILNPSDASVNQIIRAFVAKFSNTREIIHCLTPQFWDSAGLSGVAKTN